MWGWAVGCSRAGFHSLPRPPPHACIRAALRLTSGAPAPAVVPSRDAQLSLVQLTRRRCHPTRPRRPPSHALPGRSSSTPLSCPLPPLLTASASHRAATPVGPHLSTAWIAESQSIGRPRATSIGQSRSPRRPPEADKTTPPAFHRGASPAPLWAEEACTGRIVARVPAGYEPPQPREKWLGGGRAARCGALISQVGLRGPAPSRHTRIRGCKAHCFTVCRACAPHPNGAPSPQEEQADETAARDRGVWGPHNTPSTVPSPHAHIREAQASAPRRAMRQSAGPKARDGVLASALACASVGLPLAACHEDTSAGRGSNGGRLGFLQVRVGGRTRGSWWCGWGDDARLLLAPS